MILIKMIAVLYSTFSAVAAQNTLQHFVTPATKLIQGGQYEGSSCSAYALSDLPLSVSNFYTLQNTLLTLFSSPLNKKVSLLRIKPESHG